MLTKGKACQSCVIPGGCRELTHPSTDLVKYNQVSNALDKIATESTGQSTSNTYAYMKKMGEFSFILNTAMPQHILAFMNLYSQFPCSLSCVILWKLAKNANL
jgi:hypothetical protein